MRLDSTGLSLKCDDRRLGVSLKTCLQALGILDLFSSVEAKSPQE